MTVDAAQRGDILDARGEPLVSDFGLAKWLDTSSDLTRTLTIFGTPGKTGKWGWRVEGHHLSLNFTLEGNQAIVGNEVELLVSAHGGRKNAATERMKRVPAFVRGMVMKAVEESCRRNGIGRVTPEELERIRARMPTPKMFG